MRRSEECGSATVWALTWLALLLTLAQAVMLLAGLVARQHHIDAAADMSAISAAQLLQRGGEACAVAAEVASAHQATLTACRLEGADVNVEVTAQVRLPLGLSVHLHGTARAGP
jgi:secretion/DNA translocation related TadE-like protein